MPEHNTLDDTRLKLGTADPDAAPSFVGETFVQNESGKECFRVAIDTSSPDDYAVFGFVPQNHAGDPTSIKTARCNFDLCIDTSNNLLYYCTTKGSSTWDALNGIPSGGGD